MFLPFCLVFRVFSSTLLPTLHRPCLFGTPRESATLCPSSLRDLLVDSVCCRLWQHQRQDRRASLGKTHHLTICRPASCRFGSPDIRSRLITPARPPLQHHIAGSLFATYTASASCFLQTHHFWICPCLVGVVLPSGNGGPQLSQATPGTAACASCQAHVNTPPAKAGGFGLPLRGDRSAIRPIAVATQHQNHHSVPAASCSCCIPAKPHRSHTHFALPISPRPAMPAPVVGQAAPDG